MVFAMKADTALGGALRSASVQAISLDVIACRDTSGPGKNLRSQIFYDQSMKIESCNTTHHSMSSF